MNLKAALEAAQDLQRQGFPGEACVVYQDVLKQAPDHVDALQGLATAHAQRGDFVAAMQFFDRALRLQPDHAEAHARRGQVLRCLGRHHEALASLDRALQLRPRHAETHNNRGVVLRDLARLEEALAEHERAVELKPAYTNAWKNRGIVLGELRRFEEAAASHERALQLSPEDAQAFNCLGNALHRLGRHAEAAASHARAAGLRPDYAEAFYNRSIALRALGRVPEAVECCERAAEIRPDYAEAWWNLAEMLILTGDYERGWPLFEWRWRSAAYGKAFRTLDRPVWRGGDDLHGKTILVNLDGGFGDTLHFCRYAPLLQERGAQVVLEVQSGLVTLLRHSFPNMMVIANGQPLPPFDCHCPMMSLPGAFALPLGRIPSTVPYLQVPGGHAEKWRRRLGPGIRPRVGLAWSGSSDHSNDGQRSMPAGLMMHGLVSAHPHLEFHCLQKEIRPADHAAVADLPVRLWTDELADFADTAALAAQMDLVISVDTSVAHLAGALGTPTWVLLPHVPDMRWLLDRDDTPWYPGVMRLLRQDASRQWPPVIAAASGDLRRQVFATR